MTSDHQLWPKMTLLGFLGQGRRSMASCLNALNGGARSYGGYRQRLRLRTSRWFILPAFMFIFLGTIPKTFVRGNSIKSFEAVVSSSSSCLSHGYLERSLGYFTPLGPSVRLSFLSPILYPSAEQRAKYSVRSYIDAW